MNNKAGVIGGVSFSCLIITLSIRPAIFKAFARIFETFMGVFVAILVNSDIDRLRTIFWKEK